VEPSARAHKTVASAAVVTELFSLFIMQGRGFGRYSWFKPMIAFPLQRNCRTVAAGNCDFIVACPFGPNLLQAVR
jgi:hypothetical protein